MSDEIKKILELFGSADENTMFCDIVELNSKQSHLLLDYITNLQQENEKNKEYSEFYKDMSNKWKDMSDVFKKSCKDYKSRIDKAIEYINNLEKDYDVNVWQEDKHWAYILYVLQGENNIKGE